MENKPALEGAQKRVDAHFAMSVEARDLWSWAYAIKANLEATASDPLKVFFYSGTVTDMETGEKVYLYCHNGTFFEARDNGQPWRWPLV